MFRTPSPITNQDDQSIAKIKSLINKISRTTIPYMAEGKIIKYDLTFMGLFGTTFKPEVEKIKKDVAFIENAIEKFKQENEFPTQLKNFMPVAKELFESHTPLYVFISFERGLSHDEWRNQINVKDNSITTDQLENLVTIKMKEALDCWNNAKLSLDNDLKQLKKEVEQYLTGMQKNSNPVFQR